MSSGIITILALVGFLAVVFWVYIIKSGKDFEQQARQPLDDEIKERESSPQRFEKQESKEQQPDEQGHDKKESQL